MLNLRESLKQRLPSAALPAARLVYGQRPAARRERKDARDRGRVAQLVRDKLGETVLSGPFRGLILPAVPVTWDSPPKIVGCYEEELHPALEELIAHGFGTIVNVGCADGYYTVGMALRCPDAAVVGYDIGSDHRVRCAETARANGVEAEVRGECTTEDLVALGRDALVIMDCEGAEDQLVSPTMTATMLIELHDSVDQTLPDRVIARLRDTHSVETIYGTTPRTPADYPAVAFLAPQDRNVALFERPIPQRWIVARPRS